MPTFCRHNRLVQNCTICAREQNFEARPVVSSSAPKVSQPREHAGASGRAAPGWGAEADDPRGRQQRASPAAGAWRRGRLPLAAGARAEVERGCGAAGRGDRVRDTAPFAHGAGRGRRSPLATCRRSGTRSRRPGTSTARTHLAFRHVLDGPRGLKSGNRPTTPLPDLRPGVPVPARWRPPSAASPPGRRSADSSESSSGWAVSAGSTAITRL